MRQRVKYWDSGIHWIFNDNFHRYGDLPSRYYFRDGKLVTVYYHQHDKRHRITGPAYIDYRSKIKGYYYEGDVYASLEKMLMMEACR